MYKKQYYWKKVEPKPLPQLNKDIFYDIALNTDIKNIKNLSLTNQDYYKILNSNQFWIDKYSYDQLPLLNNYVTISDWIRDYIITKKAIDLLWLNQLEQDILHKNIILVFNVSDPKISDIDNLPLPHSIHVDEIMTHFIINILNDKIELECYFLYTHDQLFEFNDVSYMDKIIIIKHILLHFNFDNLLFIEDQYGVRYHLKDLLNDMVDIDDYFNWRQNYGDIIDLRKQLMLQYHLDF
jgi:hypothetical protein